MYIMKECDVRGGADKTAPLEGGTLIARGIFKMYKLNIRCIYTSFIVYL